MKNKSFNDLENLDTSLLFSDEEINEMENAFSAVGLKDWAFDSKDNSIKLIVKVVNKSRNPLPTYQKDGDSGFDFMANLADNEVVTINQFERKLIPTGLFYQIPAGFELQIRPRSGLALKHGITVLNTPATIDSGYRGEIFILLFNTDPTPFEITNGDRIAQGVIVPLQYKKTIHTKLVDMLDESERGDGRFGHTGV